VAERIRQVLIQRGIEDPTSQPITILVVAGPVSVVYLYYGKDQIRRGALQRSGHERVPRNKEQKPRVCPKCKSPYWDRPKHK